MGIKKTFKKWLNPHKKTIGLDIGSSYIKVMEIEGEELKTARLNGYAIEAIPEEINLDAEELSFEDSQLLIEAVKRCCKKANINIKNVVTSFQTERILTKNIELPISDDDDEIEEGVKNEMSRGGQDDELVIDYTIKDVDIDNKIYNIVAACVRKGEIDNLTSIIDGADLKPSIVDIEKYSIQNLVSLMKGSQFLENNYMLIDMGANKTRIYLFSDGDLIQLETVESGGVHLSRKMEEYKELSYSEVEKMKMFRDEDDNEEFEIIEANFISDYMMELTKVIETMLRTQGIQEIEEIMLTGGMANTPDIEYIFYDNIKYMQIKLNNLPYIAKPLFNIPKSVKVNMKNFDKDQSSLFLVTGLALRQYLRQY